MLQLPVTPKNRLTRIQMAKTPRRAKARAQQVNAGSDDIIALVRKADHALDRYVLALNTFRDALNKLPEEDRGWAYVSPIDALVPEFGRGYRFSSEKHIERQILAGVKRAKQRLKQARDRLKKMKPGHGSGNIRLELEQQIAAELRRIVELPKSVEPMKKAYRKEERRLAAAQRKVGLDRKRNTKNSAWLKLAELTEKINKARPTSVKGALALISYVALRNREDLFELYYHSFDAKFGVILDRTVALLARREGWRAA